LQRSPIEPYIRNYTDRQLYEHLLSHLSRMGDETMYPAAQKQREARARECWQLVREIRRRGVQLSLVG
jgi:hypothetical protein